MGLPYPPSDCNSSHITTPDSPTSTRDNNVNRKKTMTSRESCSLDEGAVVAATDWANGMLGQNKSVELRLRPRTSNNTNRNSHVNIEDDHSHSNSGKAKEEEGCNSSDAMGRTGILNDQDITRRMELLANNPEAHEVPQPPPCNSLARRGLRYLSLAAILVAWLWLTSLEAKIRAVMVALTFSAIEFHFRAVTRPSAAELNKTILNSTSTINSNPGERDMRRAIGLAQVGRVSSTDQLRALVSTARARLAQSHLRTNGHTTWEQFWANVFYGPIMNDFYRHHLFALALPSFLAWDPLAQALLLTLFYPLNIWVRTYIICSTCSNM